MRLSTALFPRLLSLSLLFLPSSFAVTQDEAYQTDWHIPLIGVSLRHSTFFHRPQTDSKASLLYTLTDKKVIAAINPRDGALVWRQSISKDALGFDAGAIKALPADGKVLSAAGSRLRAWDATDGRLLWVNEFSKEVKDAKVSKNQDVIVLCTDGSLWKVDGISGSVVEDRYTIIDQDDVSHSLHVSLDGSTSVVSLSPQEGTHRIKTTTITDHHKVDTKVLSASKVANLQSILYVGGPGIVAWLEDHGQMLMLLSLKSQFMNIIPIPEGVVRVECHAVPSHNSFLISYDSLKSSWAQIWTMEEDHRVFTKVHDIQAKPFSPTSWSANVAPNGEIYFTWSLPLGASEIYSGNSKEPLYTFSGNSTSIPSTLLSVSEVIPRADSTFALRTFLASYPDTDTHLILNGAISWTRPESLAGLKAVIWVELLDPTAEEVEGELHIEESQNIFGAYFHRVKRHIHELVTFGPAWAAHLPRRVLAEFTGTEAETIGVGKFRDTFGFRKLLIGVTANGGIVGIDFAQQGRILWSLPHLLQDISERNDVKGFYEVGKGVVGLVLASGRYIEVDVFEGKVLRTKDEEDVGKVMSTSLVDSAGDKKVILGVIRSGLTGELKAKYFGGDSNKSTLKELYFTIPDSFGDLHGFKVSSESTTVKKTFSFSPPEMELVTSIVRPIRTTPPASIGKVMGDRSVMYKYLNPNIVLVTTTRINTTDTASIYLLDSVSGAILYTATHQFVDKSKPIVSLLCENWFVYTFFAGEDPASDIPTPKGYQIVVTELYESPLKNDRGPLRGSSNFSSFEPEVMKTKPFAITQSYVSPVAITSLSATSTKQSITTIDILAFLPYPASLLSIPKRILDPRRPIGRDPDPNEREEGLFKYDPVLPVDHKSILSHKRDFLYTEGGEKVRIITSPSLMESTSLVFLYDDTDLFGTRLTPSGAFDMLGKGFGKVQLVVTVVGLAIGVWYVAPMVRKKQINQRWAPTSG